MAVRQPRQALEAPVAKELVLTLHHPPGARATHPAQLLVNLGKQTDVRRGVAPLKRVRRTAAPVLDAPGLAVLADQPRRLRPRPPRDLGDKATHDPLVRLAQPTVVQPPQRPCDEVVGAAPVREVKVDRLAAGQEVAHLLEGAQPFDVESQDHPPMIPSPPRSGSCLVGFAPPVQAHLSWDKTEGRLLLPDPATFERPVCEGLPEKTQGSIRES